MSHQQSLSSFFKPSASTSSKVTKNEVEVIELDDDDDDFARFGDVLPPKHDIKGKSKSTEPVLKLSAFRVGAQTPAGQLSTPSEADLAARRRFRERMLAVPMTKSQSGYLQNDHFMSPNFSGSNSAADTPAFDEEDEMDELEDSEQEDEPAKKKRKTSASNDSSGSRFSQFAASGSTSKAGTTKQKATKLTPLEEQVQQLRECHKDKLLMFEVGYKYRFYEADAQIASRLLGIACFRQRHFLTASVPTHRLKVHVKKLINAGHKVGVVGQLETAALKKVGANRSGPFERGLTDVYTYATLVDDLNQEPISDSTPTLLTLVEQPIGTDNEKVRIGLVAVRTMTGEITYDQFDDNLMRAELETRILHLQPAELLLEENISQASEGMLKYLVNQGTSWDRSCRIERFQMSKKPGAAHTWLADFLADSLKPRGLANEDDEDDDDIIIESDLPASSNDHSDRFGAILDLPNLVLVALQATINHLSSFNLTSMFLESESYVSFAQQSAMSLSGNTLANLEVLRNATDFTSRGSLLSIVDSCKTAFGRRLLRRWLTRPLLSLEKIRERADAVDELVKSNSLTVSKLTSLLKAMPDLERGLIRIHIGKATPIELVSVLWAFQRIGDVFAGLSDPQNALDTALLRQIAKSLPAASREAKTFLSQIDTTAARQNKKEDMFVDSDATEDLFDAKCNLSVVQAELKGALEGCRKTLGRPKLEYKSVANEDYLIEVTRAGGDKQVPVDWIRINATKTAIRYRPPQVQKLVEELERCKETLASVAQGTYLALLKRVSERHEVLRAIVADLATLDCLSSLASMASRPGYIRPQFVEEDGKLDIVKGRHPMVEHVMPDPFVPNDIRLGDETTRQIILTGLNMGGKSSFSRSVALIVLLAQIGSHVPAEACTLSVFDSIFTRMGASDEIARGRSTFMVEMTEASEILKLATRRSLIILDELGRGTSTLDGQAIAHAVLEHIVTKIQACTCFITHYPSLAEVEKNHPDRVSCWHMACIERERSDGFADVTFLYQVKRGLASKSHGLNVARMAQLPDSVLRTALRKSQELEQTFEQRRVEKWAERMRDLLEALMSNASDDHVVALARACLR